MSIAAPTPFVSSDKTTCSVTSLKIVIGFLLVLCLALVITIGILSFELNARKALPDIQQDCPDGMLFKPRNTSSRIFDDLAEAEILAVRDYILGQASLNVTPFKKATLNSNYINLIELQQPPKHDALKYLNNNGPKPERKARVVVFKGGEVVPVVEEYLVGPVDKPTRHTLRNVGHVNPIPFHTRFFDSIHDKIIENIMVNVTKHAYRLLAESYDGYTYHNCTDRCLMWSSSLPGAMKSGEHKVWIWFMRNVPGFYIQPVGLQILLNCPGTNANKWSIEMIFYRSDTFRSVDQLMAAYDRGTIQKMFLPAPNKPGATYSSYLRRGIPQPPKPTRGPRQIEPDGKRYTVESRHVEYMGWSFDFRARTSSGVQIFDINFKGERLVYELGVQEAAAFYSGFSPMQMFADYLDTAWGLGSSTFELVRGVDCPYSATFIDIIHHYDSPRPLKYKNAICLFEFNTGIPLRRHFDDDFEGGYKFYGGIPTYALVLRYVSTPYNYDYVFDYIFYANGVVEAKVSTSGYIQAVHWTSAEFPYGNEVHKGVAGTLHDHLINYKVDLDVAGKENSYQTIDIEVENITNPWFPDRYFTQKVIRRRTKNTEQEALYKFNFDHPKYLNFFNEKEKNKQGGQQRGYRIQIRDMIKQMYPESKPLVNGAAWSLHQMAVTKYKETELSSSSIYNQMDPYKPVVDFRKFYEDNENIRNEDLVAWVTVGLMHVPHTEDIPNTATPGNSASFFIRPYNYFEEDPSMASSDAVLIKPTDAKFSGVKVNRFGTPQGPSCTPKDRPFTYNGTYGLN